MSKNTNNTTNQSTSTELEEKNEKFENSIEKNIENDEKDISIQNTEEGNHSEEEKNEITDIEKSTHEQEEKSDNSDAIKPPKVDDSVEAPKVKHSIEKNTEKKSHKTLIGVLIAFIVILILGLLFSTVFALATSNSNTVIKGVSIKDIDVSGLTREQALEKLTAAFNNKVSQKITLKHNEFELEVVPRQFGVSFDLDKAIDLAYNKGRAGNIFENNYEILVSMFSGITFNPSFSYSEETLDSLITEMQSNLPDRLIEPNYYVDGNNLVLAKGKDGVVIDSAKLKNDIIYAINNLEYNVSQIEIPVISKQAGTLDLNKIHEEIYRAPKDAYYTTNPYVVYPHVDGIDFSISVEEAIKNYEASPESYSIPLKVLKPKVTTSQIGSEAFPNLLASYSTSFSTSNVNRSTNIRLATAKINGTVIMPGETFSYNQTVGKRTAAAGFKSAAVYSGGEVTTGIGGGICQVSSTLYNSVLLSNLEIVERYNHGFNPGYVPAGRDATVSWGGPDFKFKNSRDYPVKIAASVSGGTVTVKIWGLKKENDYDVEIQSYITQYIKYSTVQKNDSNMAKGTTKVLQNGSNGCKAVCYRILKQNGAVVSKKLVSSDTYNPHNKVVAVGTHE